MKKLVYLLLLLPFLLSSCELDTEAYFSATPGDPVVGEIVYFNNESENAVRFNWDFGDGYGSDEPNPAHSFNASGTYEVKLKVWSENGYSDEAFMTVEVKIPTLLEIEVLEYFEKYPVAGASVRLYPSLPDWEEETSLEAEGLTDNDGFIVFSGLGTYVWYADIWEENHDNYSLKLDDIGFIRIPEVIPNRINRFTAYVDYVDHVKGEGRKEGRAVIKKLERKYSPEILLLNTSDTTGWKQLWLKSIKVK